MYSTLADMSALVPADTLIDLTDDAAAGVVNEAIVNEAIARADAEIDGYCGGRYAVPLNPVPALVRAMSADIALWHLYTRRVEEMPKVREDSYKGAVRMLQGIAAGSVSLGVAEAPSPADTGDGAETNKAVNTNVFDRETLAGF